MVREAYFHLEGIVDGNFELLESGYKVYGLQFPITGLRKVDFRDFTSTDPEVSMGLLKEMHRSVYGCPMSKKSRVTIDEMISIKSVKLGILNMREAESNNELQELLNLIKKLLHDNLFKITDTDKYRVVIEIPN